MRKLAMFLVLGALGFVPAAIAFGDSTPNAAQSTSTTTSHVSPAAACRTERAADPAAFKAKYGKNHTMANAFGKCVSVKAKVQSAKS